jgi:hypothetical protein
MEILTILFAALAPTAGVALAVWLVVELLSWLGRRNAHAPGE